MIKSLKNNLMRVLKLLPVFLSIIFMQPSAQADEKTTDVGLNGETVTVETSLPKLPRIDISANIGYGFLLTKTKGLTGAEKKMEDDLSSGLTWDFRFHSYFKSYYGLGIMYSGYHSSAWYNGNDLSADITYIAPLFCIKGAFGKTNLMLKSEIGIGFLHLKEKVSFNSYRAEVVTGSTLGSNCTVGLEYRFCKYLGLGLDIDGVFGSIKSLKDSRGNKYEAEDVRIGVSRINIFLGLRCYLK